MQTADVLLNSPFHDFSQFNASWLANVDCSRSDCMVPCQASPAWLMCPFYLTNKCQRTARKNCVRAKAMQETNKELDLLIDIATNLNSI